MELEYKFEIKDADTPNKRFTWSGVGEHGAVHVWAQFMEKPSFGEKCYGGIEVHSKTPLYGENDPPSHDNCWLLNGPCWHDGSSLWFSENIQPMIESYEDDPEKLSPMIDSEIFSWYKSRFGEEL